MLGGKAPVVDKDLIVDWFAADWEENMYPGAPYAQGRDLLREHLIAMLDLDVNGTPKISLNGRWSNRRRRPWLACASPSAPIRFSNPRRASKSSRTGSPHSAAAPIWRWFLRPANGANLETIRVPAFFTYPGFYHALLDHMTTIADKMQKEQWVLGASGDQEAVKQQYASMMPDILDLYGKEFIAAWNVALGNLTLRPLVADKPKYLALSAASAPTSPIKQIFESVRDETSLTREPKTAAKKDDNGQKAEAAQDATQILRNHLGSVSNEALSLAMKSQRRAGDAAPEVPART